MNNYSFGALLSLVIFSLGFIALTLGLKVFNMDRKSFASRKMFALCVCTFFWTSGYALMGLCYNDDFAYIPRAISLFAINLYILVVIDYITYLSNAPKKLFYIFSIFYIPTAIVSWLEIISKDAIDFVVTPYGYYYQNHFTWARIVQFITIFAGLCLFYVILGYWKRRTKHKRYRQLIRYFCWFGILLVVGYMFDTIFPMFFDMASFPGSAIGAFFSSLLLYTSAKKYKAFDASVNGISDYVFGHVDTPIVVLSEDGEIILSNSKANEFFNMTAEELKGTKQEDFFYPVYDDEYDEIEFADGPEDVIYKLRNSDICCKLATTDVNDEFDELLYTIVFIQDMTNEQRIIQLMSERSEVAEAANRAKSAFLANMSHEIRTPMNAIIGMSDILLQNDLSDEIQSQVADLRSAGESLLGIINDVLDISKIESGKYELIDEKYDLPSMLHDISNVIGVRLLDTPVKFNLKINPSMPATIIGDVLRIRQILYNIIGNAVKFTKEGSITLTVDWNEDVDDAEIYFDVTDTGIGIKEEHIKTIFGIFNQVDTRKNREIQGSGLGLAISKNLAELMHGTITVESVYGEGSCFHISIKQTIKNYQSIGETVAESIENNKYEHNLVNKTLDIEPIPDARVLVVDDNRINLTVAKGIMKPYEMQVDAVMSGKEAIEMVQENDYDIIFMDHMMPELDGIDTTHLIRELDDEKFKTIPIIALTANAVGDAREMFLKEGFQDFVPKPIDKKALDKVIRKWIQK